VQLKEEERLSSCTVFYYENGGITRTALVIIECDMLGRLAKDCR